MNAVVRLQWSPVRWFYEDSEIDTEHDIGFLSRSHLADSETMCIEDV
jgi:hypothetical protein